MLQRGVSASGLQGVQEERVRQGVALLGQDALQMPHRHRRAVQPIEGLPQCIARQMQEREITSTSLQGQCMGRCQ